MAQSLVLIAVLLFADLVQAASKKDWGQCAEAMGTQTYAFSPTRIATEVWRKIATSNYVRIKLEVEGGLNIALVTRQKANGIWLERIDLENGKTLSEKRLPPPKELVIHELGVSEEMVVQEMKVGDVEYRVEDHYRQGGSRNLWIWQRSVLLRRDDSRTYSIKN